MLQVAYGFKPQQPNFIGTGPVVGTATISVRGKMYPMGKVGLIGQP